MGSRTLIWTGAAGTTDFATAANWEDAGTYQTAKYAPARDDTVELLGAGTITGTGTVAVLDVAAGTGGGFYLDGTFAAKTVSDTGTLDLSEGTLSAARLTVGSDSAGGSLGIGEYGTLSALGEALGVTIGSSSGATLGIDFGAANLGSGTLTVGGAGGSGASGFLGSNGATIVAGELAIGLADYGIAYFGTTTLTLGTAHGGGLLVTSTAGAAGYPGAELQAQSSDLVLKGALDIGTEGGGAVTLTNSTLTTNAGVSIGSEIGAGTLSITGSAPWTDTGNVMVGQGSVLELTTTVATPAYASISGNLSLAAYSQVDLAYQEFLSISGDLLMKASQFHSMAGAFVSARNVILTGYSGLSLEGNADGSTLNLRTTGTINVGSIASVSMHQAYGDVGNNAGGVAASVAGTWAQVGGETAFAGALSVNGGTLDLSNDGSISVTSTGPAIVLRDAVVFDDYSLLSANGGIEVLDGSSVDSEEGTVEAAAVPGHEALYVDSTSELNAGTLTLTGNATVNGTLYIGNARFTGGTLTVGADGALTAAGSISDAVYNAGNISGGNLTFSGPLFGSGTVSLASEGTLALLGAVSNRLTAEFAITGTITLGDAAAFHGDIAGWASGDTLDLLNLVATSDSVSGQSLTLYGSTHEKLAVLHFAQPITSGEFSLAHGVSGNTILTHP